MEQRGPPPTTKLIGFIKRVRLHCNTLHWTSNIRQASDNKRLQDQFLQLPKADDDLRNQSMCILGRKAAFLSHMMSYRHPSNSVQWFHSIVTFSFIMTFCTCEKNYFTTATICFFLSDTNGTDPGLLCLRRFSSLETKPQKSSAVSTKI